MKETEFKIYTENLDKLREETGVYLIRNLDNNKLKIGITNNLMRRLKEIQKSFQFCGVIPELKIECFIEYEYNLELEQYLHKQLKEYNYQNEWFSIDDINIVLENLKGFEHIEPVRNIKNDNPINGETKILNNVIIEPDKFYLYKSVEKNSDTQKYETKKIYIKSNYGSNQAIYYINKIHNKIFEDINYYRECLDNDDLDLCIELSFNKKLEDLFIKYDSKAVIEYKQNEYMSLEHYLLNEYKENILYIFEKVKENTINKLNNSDNIVEDIEQTCISIQKDLNNCIRYKNRQNYRRLY